LPEKRPPVRALLLCCICSEHLSLHPAESGYSWVLPAVPEAACQRAETADASAISCSALLAHFVLALRIIEIAQLGERDPNRFREDAPRDLGRTNLKSTGM
jgi:hypothetical protein